MALFVLVDNAVAWAGYRGTDMWSNLMPGGGADGLADRYPLSFYQLDYYVDGVKVGYVPVEHAQCGQVAAANAEKRIRPLGRLSVT